MIRFWGQTMSAALLTLVTGSALPACAHNDASLYVDGVLGPPPPSGNECIYTPDPTTLHIAHGTVDAALRDNYSPEFLLGNTLIQQGNANTPNSETARIEIQGAIVQVVDPGTNATVESNSVLTSGLLEPASGTTPSYAVTNATIMNAAAIKHFDPGASGQTKIALVNVTFYGTTLGGQSIQSNQYQFPVDVCHGCLVAVPPGAPTGALDYCAGKSALNSSDLACSVGQDQISDCQLCYNNDTQGVLPNPACDLTK
jgi:hypothetical protein